MERGYPLRVLETGTWRVVYTGRFEARTYGADFFADSQTMLVGYPTAARAIVDLSTGARTVQTGIYDSHRHDNYHAAGDRTVLSIHVETPPSEAMTVALLELPDYREIVKVPYAIQPRKAHPVKGSLTLSTDGGPILSDSRKVLLYSFDAVLVCRRVADLALLWTTSVESSLEFIKFAISADGTRIAASVGDPRVDDLTRGWRQHYLGVYDGGTGEEVTRLQIDGTDGITLSHDGTLIAVVSHERGGKGAVVPTVSIYEILSGRKIASVVHGPVKQGRHQWLDAGIVVAFTSDGKYLITSGMATRVWSLGDVIGQHA
jgi:hypothetical protein